MMYIAVDYGNTLIKSKGLDRSIKFKGLDKSHGFADHIQRTERVKCSDPSCEYKLF